MSHKLIYASNIIDTVINEFSPNDESSHLRICDHFIITIGIREKCLGFLNTYHVDSLDRFRISVFDELKTDKFILQISYHSK